MKLTLGQTKNRGKLSLRSAMSLIHHDAISLAFDAYANTRRVLWLVGDDALAEAAGGLADLAAVIAGMPGQAHFLATTATCGSLEDCGAGLIEFRGSRRYRQCALPCSEDVWPRPSAGERCPRCGGAVRENVLAGVGDDWVSARLALQEIALAAWRQAPGGALAIELGALAGSPQLQDLARRAAALRVCCSAAGDGVGADGAIRLAQPGAGFLARLRAGLSSSGLLAASPRP